MQDSKLPPYIEETEEDQSRFSSLQDNEDYPVLLKKINNRIAEHAQAMVTEKDLEFATRIDELTSLLSEITNE